ncbi:uncharacterized protein PF3D7_1120600-like [Cataglyphis hispanica]|uniref:uncharacterized protein PF3D7_1120600-like n=1 Tax=Cataglyphis hispanica TaxID=1086592 RepID=UPI0021802D25|nr:uncharacterized protein PF3D7_1120600-like [Cataglyphis hispanica]XP_050464304.1 uncharacterized protein PF3D7_1120600-like [Cataglyphis hispanica]
MFRIKTTSHQADYSTYGCQSESSVREISKPVRITQLFGSCKQSRNGQTNLTGKIRLPERITPHLKSASNRKGNETTTHIKLSHNKKNVRRNLSFTKIPVVMTKTETVIRSKNNLNDSSKKENLHLSTRKSFLLPPNSVKNSYVKNRAKQTNFILPQICISDYSVCDNKYPRISERSESCSSPMRVTSSQINSVIHEQVNETMIQHLSSQMFTVHDQSGIDILHSECIDTKNDELGRKIVNSSINVEEKKCLSMTKNNYREDLHQSARNVEMINQPCLNLNHSANKNDEYVTLNKTQLTVLATKLEHDIRRLEEDILPNLRFTFTTIMDVLSAINITKKESDNNDTKIMQQMPENLNDRIKIMNDINTKSLCVISNINTEDNINIKENINNEESLCMISNINTEDNINIKENINNEESLCMISNINTEDNIKENINNEESINIEDSHIPKEIYKTPDINLMKFVKTDICEKNNSRIRSLCQFDLSSESNKENDSFVNLENMLDITNIKSNMTIVSLKKSTPVLKYKNKKEERPLKEYMALKSRMSCLLTPNIKHFSCSKAKNDNLYSESSDAKASLSGKILAELYNLYED